MIERFEKFHSNVALAHKYITKIKTHKMNEFGLKAANVMCLFFLGKNPRGLTPSELCRLCGEDKAGISKSLSALKEKDYITTDGEDKKYRIVYKITKKGSDVFEQISSYIVEVVKSAGSDLSDAQRDIFYSALNNIVDNLRVICSKIDA